MGVASVSGRRLPGDGLLQLSLTATPAPPARLSTRGRGFREPASQRPAKAASACSMVDFFRPPPAARPWGSWPAAGQLAGGNGTAVRCRAVGGPLGLEDKPPSHPEALDVL